MTRLPEAVILIGAGGFIGRNIVEALKGRVGSLIGVGRRGARIPGCDQVVTLSELDQLPHLPEETLLINVAAYRYDAVTFSAEQSQILRENAAIAVTAYAFCVARNIKEVRQASTVAVYPAGTNPQDDAVPVDLNAPPYPGEAAYAWSRRFLEVAADLHRDLYGIHTVTFRLSNPYGPFDTLNPAAAHVATAFVIRALSDTPHFEILGNPEAERDFVFSGDVAAVFVESCRRRGLHATYNLAQGETVSIRRLAEIVLAAAGSDRSIVVSGAAPPDVNIRRPTAARLRAAFPNIAFRSLAQGMAETIPWYRHALCR